MSAKRAALWGIAAALLVAASLFLLRRGEARQAELDARLALPLVNEPEAIVRRWFDAAEAGNATKAQEVRFPMPGEGGRVVRAANMCCVRLDKITIETDRAWLDGWRSGHAWVMQQVTKDRASNQRVFRVDFTSLTDELGMHEGPVTWRVWTVRDEDGRWWIVDIGAA